MSDNQPVCSSSQSVSVQLTDTSRPAPAGQMQSETKTEGCAQLDGALGVTRGNGAVASAGQMFRDLQGLLSVVVCL